MNELKKAVNEEAKEEMNKAIVRVNTDLQQALSYEGKKYQGDEETQKKKLLRFIKRRIDKRLQEDLNKIDEVVNNEVGLPKPLVITIERNKSYIWGSNLTAHTNYGFDGSSIGGCGYCKLSTATAQALNSHPYIIKKLYEKENERLKLLKDQKEKGDLSRRSFIGYGSGYGVLPCFEGGVGVSSHETVIENIGLSMRSISYTDNTDVYMVGEQ